MAKGEQKSNREKKKPKQDKKKAPAVSVSPFAAANPPGNRPRRASPRNAAETDPRASAQKLMGLMVGQREKPAARRLGERRFPLGLRRVLEQVQVRRGSRSCRSAGSRSNGRRNSPG
ncbi:hypothetical protein [Methyloceanibacter marginalis]|uniref:hypothetical protein n=1 Tax=Methyloceanibacter marginalis TaxID=1774971 RepID=UPI000A7491F4|nr:hypothetical protein [Methyloceanibacter marginalis]